MQFVSGEPIRCGEPAISGMSVDCTRAPNESLDPFSKLHVLKQTHRPGFVQECLAALNLETFHACSWCNQDISESNAGRMIALAGHTLSVHTQIPNVMLDDHIHALDSAGAQERVNPGM